VQVGRTLTPRDVAGATIHVDARSFGHKASSTISRSKAWEFIKARKGTGQVVFSGM
jgi:hypothetical protein